MSNPPNPLSKYRTSSYQQLLILCDSTSTAERLGKDDDNFKNLYSRSGTRLENGEMPNPERIGKGDDVGEYYMLINSAKDADLVIGEVNWSTAIASEVGNNGEANTTTSALDGTMKVGEPQAARFLNILNKSYDALKRDPSGCCFLIKTIFVGHTDGDTTDYIFHVKPMMFVLLNIVSLFDTTGSSYTISFVGMANGISRIPQTLECIDNITVYPEKSTVKGAIDKLQQNIERNYGFHLCKLRTTGNLPEPFGKSVKYIVELDDEYKKPEYKLDKQLDKVKNTGTKADPGVLTFGAKPTIEGAIHKILKMSKKVVEEGAKPKDDDAEKKIFLYKITSTLLSGNDAQALYGVEYAFIYRIIRYEQSLNSIAGKLLNANGEPSVPGNSIEFDYYFTGKNVDVLQFDIKMEQGMTFLYSLSTTDSLPQTSADAVDNTRKSSLTNDGVGNMQVSESKAASFGGIRRESPILFSTNVRKPSGRNVTDSDQTSSFNSQLSRHARLESAEAKIKIIGNPILLNNLIRTPKEIAENTPPTKHDGDIAVDFEKIPALVKVNVRMPINDSDKNFSDSFWYDGFFQIVAVVHTFSSGQFTQELTMISVPVIPQKDVEPSSSGGAFINGSKELANKIGLGGDVRFGEFLVDTVTSAGEALASGRALCESKFRIIDTVNQPPVGSNVNTGKSFEKQKAKDDGISSS